MDRRGDVDVLFARPGPEHLRRPADLAYDILCGHLGRAFPVLVAVPASEVAALREVPLDEEIKVLNCRTGNHVPFHFFQLKHCLPDSAAFIIFQNDASWRLACSVRTFFFLVFIGISPPFRIMWPGIIRSARRGSPVGKANHPMRVTGSIGIKLAGIT
jgi:hypothetical protein